MFNSRRERCTLASVAVLFLLVGSVFSPFFWVGAAGEKSVTEDNLLFNDGTNAMAADLDLGGFELEDVGGLWYGESNRTDLIAYPENVNSYTVFVQGSNVLAKNGTTQQIDYNSTDAQYVVQSLINLIENGVIVVKDDIVVTETIVVNKTGIVLTGDSGYTKISTSADTAIIRVDRPSGDLNLGSVVKNFVLQGGGRSDTNSIGVHVNDAWGLKLENLVIGDVYNGIEITNSGLYYAKDIFIEPLSEWSLSNCYNGIYQSYSSGDGLIGFWDSIDVGICENDAVHIEKLNSLWASNWRLIESGRYGLSVFNATAASNFQNIQIDDMHVDALHLEGVIDTTFEGCWFKAAPSTSSGYPSLGIPSGSGDRSIYVNGSLRILFSDCEMHGGDQETVYVCDSSWWIQFVNCYSWSDSSDMFVFDSSNGITLNTVVIDAQSGVSAKTGVLFSGSSPSSESAGTKLVGVSVSSAYGTASNLSADDYWTATLCPEIKTENSGNVTIAHDEWVEHGLATTPTFVIPSLITVIYDSETVLVTWANQNSTHFQVWCHWTNGTQISDDAIAIGWYAEYRP